MKETAYLLQAVLVSIWWLGLASSEPFFDAFQFAGITPTAFWSFFAPDIVVVAALSLLRAYRNSQPLEFIILGGFGYGALYCLNATLLTGSGYLPTGLMLTALCYNAFLCFHETMFRTSSSRSVRTNAAKTVVQIVCIWLLALVVVPYVLLESFDELKLPTVGIAFWSGVALFLLFSALGLTSAYFMVRDGDGTPLPLDQTNKLVVSGPYRYVRNPMVIAGIGQGLSLAIVFQSLPLGVYSVLGAVVWQMVVRPLEERDLNNRFGEAFLRYRQQVSCWIPRIRRLKADS